MISQISVSQRSAPSSKRESCVAASINSSRNPSNRKSPIRSDAETRNSLNPPEPVIKGAAPKKKKTRRRRFSKRSSSSHGNESNFSGESLIFSSLSTAKLTNTGRENISINGKVCGLAWQRVQNKTAAPEESTRGPPERRSTGRSGQQLPLLGQPQATVFRVKLPPAASVDFEMSTLALRPILPFLPVADVRSSTAFQVLSASYMSQIASSEPIADVEKLLAAASPEIMTSSVDFLGSDEATGFSGRSLADVWSWYEEAGAYGVGVKAEPSRNSANGGNEGDLPFVAFFVPSLSSVQLFSRPRCCEAEAADDSALLFEFFEHERPDQRKPLCAKVKELAEGAASDCQIYGDPSRLEDMNLRDIHPASWYSVAWYPIYRIPQGALRASFLTYHSLGHVARRRNRGGAASSIVYPALGMESYNAQGEGWLEPRVGWLEPDGALRRRLTALGLAAAALSRGTVSRGLAELRNSHPDYEFFLSRK